MVGSYEVTRQAFEFDNRRALTILALISLSLAVINLFPFLPLDGGHIFWSVVEKIRGRPVPFRIMEQSGVIGFMLVIFLFVVGFTNDIGRLTGDGFDTRCSGAVCSPLRLGREERDGARNGRSADQPEGRGGADGRAGVRQHRAVRARIASRSARAAASSR